MIQRKKKSQGYAIVVVMILLIIGTVAMIHFNRESFFFTKISGFFSRSKKVEAVAQEGIDRARADIIQLTKNAPGGVDTFTNLTTGGQLAACNQGLYEGSYNSSCTSRTLTPRISKTDGDFQLNVYYFPENPCSTPTSTSCPNTGEYNLMLPKRFLVVSEAVNTTNGEVFTAESRLQVGFENFSEVAYGIEGVKCLNNTSPCTQPYPNTAFIDISPAIYGRAHFDLPPSQLRFIFNNSDNLADRKEHHIFQDLVTFSNPAPSGQKPFQVFEPSVNERQADGSWLASSTKKYRPMISFEKGYLDNQPLTTSAQTDPSSPTYFAQMQTKANSSGGGIDFSGDTTNFPCTANSAGRNEAHICLKFEGNQIKKYNCQMYNDHIMGRIDKNIHPQTSYSATPQPGKTMVATGLFTPGMESSFPDRYVGEHAEVYSNGATPAPGSSVIAPANGVVFCDRGSGCDCNIHIKGILDGQVNIVSQYVTIEGDIRYKNQGETSTNTLGVIAQKQIIIPAAVPAASTSMHDYAADNPSQPDTEAPFPSSPGGPITNLAQTYLGITNFIPYDSGAGQYVDRNATDTDYASYTNWADGSGKRYGSPNILDLDGAFYAGDTIKVDGVYNPSDSSKPGEVDSTGSATQGIAVITCEDPPACTNYKYRNPAAPASDPKALYVYDSGGNPVLDINGNKVLVPSSTSGTVQPLYYADGLQKNNFKIAQDHNEPNNPNFNNVSFQPGEEVARPLNPLINVYGSMHSKYHFIYEKLTNTANFYYRMGFKRKMIHNDPRAAFLHPPGYPSTARIVISELHSQNHMGKSTLVP